MPLITPDGDVGFVQYQGANRQLASAHAADLPDCDVLLLQGEINAATSETAARVIRRRGGIVVLNPAPVHDVSDALIDAATVITPNVVEARALADRGEGDPGFDGPALAERLSAEGRGVVVTLGVLGAAWAHDDEHGTHPGFEIEAVDSTGAGDAFSAAFAIALAEDGSYADAVRFACAAGAHTATVHGAEPSLPTRAQVERLLADAPEHA